ncbi:hypothetical protein [Chitinophaga nivalis]|uniref:Uncharacterized protein n=1 Tax=Chitinophaga nivalis TaxID=2991709 RepID=A0ABT3IJP6_9BACT|nr:hypothetical protein [Chitinophaga nivalis]MCW3466122.1 hypothetical protein [Chitinophaga nivalis]MCW3484187.1 hypothetical protein [Chitinophaga nivalis]
MTLLHKTDEYFRKRLIWQATKHNLPAAYSFLYDDLPEATKTYLAAQIDMESAGIPVLFFTTPSQEWTLLCTRQLIGYNQGVYVLPLKEITFITSKKRTSQLAGDSRLPKGEWHELEVKDQQEQIFLFHAHKGGEFFALWNLLLMMRRFNQE